MSKEEDDSWIIFAICFSSFVAFIFGAWTVTLMMNESDTCFHVNTLNEWCANVQGANYMFDRINRDYDNDLVDEQIVCKLRPESTPLFVEQNDSCVRL